MGNHRSGTCRTNHHANRIAVGVEASAGALSRSHSVRCRHPPSTGGSESDGANGPSAWPRPNDFRPRKGVCAGCAGLNVKSDIPKLSVVILTYNEEANLVKCLSSLSGMPWDCFIVDSGSTDRTLELAKRFSAQISHHKFLTHTAQWQWALETLPLQTEWVLGLDADQSLSERLKEEIQLVLAGEHHVLRLESLDGLYVNRAHIYRGRLIRHGGCYPKYLLKLFRRSSVYLDPVTDLLDHHFY